MIFWFEKDKPINENDYSELVEEMPEPIGGINSIQEKIQYPEIAKRAGIEGKVFILAYIDENGNVAHTKIIKGIGAGCDEMAQMQLSKLSLIPEGKEENHKSTSHNSNSI